MERAYNIGRAKGMHDCGCSIREISQALAVPKSTVQDWRSFDFHFQRHRGSGRKRVTTARDERLIGRIATQNPELSISDIRGSLAVDVSKHTVWRRLREQGFKSRKRLSAVQLSDAHKAGRLRFAMAHCLWRTPQWSRIVWSDEARVCVNKRDGRLRIWLKPTHKLKKELVVPIVQGGGGSVLIWGAIWTGGRSELFMTHQTMDSQRYCDVLDRYVAPLVQVLGNPQQNCFFMDDNARPHTSRVSTAKKEELRLRNLQWPSCSPDLNPIEHVWAWMKLKVRRQLRAWDNMNRLEELIRNAWESIPQHVIDSLVSSMSGRIAETIENKGGNTSY